MTNKKRTVNKPNACYKKGEPHNVYNLVALFTLCFNFMLNRADKILLYQADSPSRRSPLVSSLRARRAAAAPSAVRDGPSVRGRAARIPRPDPPVFSRYKNTNLTSVLHDRSVMR